MILYGTRRPRAPLTKIRPSTLADAGIIGPILFMTVLLAQDLLRSEYDPLAVGLSPLRMGPYGWVQSVNFVVLGIAMIAFSAGLHRGVHGFGAGFIGPAILTWSGVALVFAGVFPLRESTEGFGYQPDALYAVNNSSLGLSLSIGLIVLSRRLTRDTRWRSLAPLTLTTGVAVLVMAMSTNFLAVLEPWYGLMRRATFLAWSIAIVVLGLRLRRLGKDAGIRSEPRAVPGQRQPF